MKIRTFISLFILIAAFIFIEGCAMAPCAKMASVQEGSRITTGAGFGSFFDLEELHIFDDTTSSFSSLLTFFCRFTMGEYNRGKSSYDHNFTLALNKDLTNDNDFHSLFYEIRQTGASNKKMKFAFGCEYGLVYFENRDLDGCFTRIGSNCVFNVGLNFYLSANEHYGEFLNTEKPLFYSRLRIAGPTDNGDISLTAGLKFPINNPVYLEGQISLTSGFSLALGTELGL